MPLLHVIVLLTLIAIALLVVGLTWYFVLAGYALILLVMIVLYKR